MQLVNKSTIDSKWNVFKNQKKTLQTILFTTFNQPLKVLFHKTSVCCFFLSKNHSNVIFMVEVAYGSRVKSSWIKKNNLKIQVFFNSWTLFHSWICGSNCRYTGEVKQFHKRMPFTIRYGSENMVKPDVIL